MTLDDRANLEPGELARLTTELGALHMLEDVVRWGFARSPPRSVEDIVIQDEFTHDVIIPFDAGRWLVFGTT